MLGSIAARVFVALTCWAVFASALKFNMAAVPYAAGKKKCFTQWVPQNTLVMLNLNASPGAHMRVDVEVFDTTVHRNEYARKKDIAETKIAFTTHEFADISVCIMNHLAQGPEFFRRIEMHLDVGADTVDYEMMAKREKLKPMEIELRRLEKMVDEIVDDVEYLKRREARMRDTNESTNERVQWFNILSILALIGLGLWQLVYLRQFFHSKKLI
ncbi:emp24/gp25L/p24 family/GOLD-domain-containing protein [Syncephalis pseudoplumigaleata]|uniref:Emp24/gp25L/p24 family/GOLD-domain-containing protein n=1 Tax=Syncephalis pseudoplumigaleata TaxID=1712513 RepID=A0A4P9YWX8_9FUNG|nr:emp24/gp25L/p24 family/GOLD-domain-containing protein [Syncephalis pseudoplumigaleata]|eukprot:RKP24365.1 emp24/gp25L/p24 family/GOLD-domain-containing protein [Syncephalis pseudoplumigaleata]